MSSIVLKDINKDYNGTEVLFGIDLEIGSSEFAVIIGESGCGKSTLLRLICGLESISSGDLFLDGRRANDISPQERDISMVFQSYALYPHMNVYKNISYGLKIAKAPFEEINKKVKSVAELLNIDKYLGRLPKNLSGGQRQRVAMGRAIVRNPKYFLFDEPLSNLDAKLRVVMRSEIKKLQKNLGVTTVYVTHDQIEAMTMADKIILMDKGRIIQVGTPKDLYDRPNSIFSASFLGSPKISLIKGVISIEDDRPVFYSEDNILFPMDLSAYPLKNGQNIILGIRPRDFFVTEEENGFEVTVDIHEYTGAEDVIYGYIGKNKVNIAIMRRDDLDFDRIQSFYVDYDRSRICLFDKESNKLIT